MADTSFFTDGEAYDRMMARWSRAAGEVFLDWLALPQGLRWLDVGCGTGVFTELLSAKQKPSAVSALDPAVDQLSHARTKPLAKDVDFRLGDARSLPFADREFDVATMALVITFVPDAATAVAEMKRVVKPGGTIGAYMWDFLGGSSPMQPLRSAVEAMGIEVAPTPGHVNSSLDGLRHLFTAARLENVATDVIEVEAAYQSFEEFWAAQTGLGNTVVQHIRKMPPADVETVKARLRHHVPADRNGRIAYTAKANAVKGRVPQ